MSTALRFAAPMIRKKPGNTGQNGVRRRVPLEGVELENRPLNGTGECLDPHDYRDLGSRGTSPIAQLHVPLQSKCSHAWWRHPCPPPQATLSQTIGLMNAHGFADVSQ